MTNENSVSPAPVHPLVGQTVYIIQGIQKDDKIAKATLMDYYPARATYKYLVCIHKLNNGLYSWAKIYKSRRSCAAAIAANRRWFNFRVSRCLPNRAIDGNPESPQ